MACSRMLILLAVVSLALSAHGQPIVSTQTQVVNRLVPVTSRVVNTGAGSIIATPAASVLGRKLLQTAPKLSPGFNQTLLPIFSAKNTFAFLGQIKQQPGTDNVGYTFIFGEEAQPFLKSVAVSGADYKFVGAYTILPADQTPTNAPPSEFSPTGFVSTDGSATTSILTTQTPSGVVPNVALRFDYTQTVGAATISVYYTDRKAATGYGGLATANLAQSFGVYIAPDGTVYPGQG